MTAEGQIEDRRTMPPDIEIKAALGGRIAQALLLAVGGFVAVLITVALAGRGTPWAALAAVALGVWITYHYRLLSMAVVVRGDELEARNLFSTHRIHRASVGDVGLGESSVAKSPNQTVVIRLSNGRTVTLDACARTQQTRRKRRRVEDFQRRLAEWSDFETDEAVPSCQAETSTLDVPLLATAEAAPG